MISTHVPAWYTSTYGHLTHVAILDSGSVTGKTRIHLQIAIHAVPCNVPSVPAVQTVQLRNRLTPAGIARKPVFFF